MERALCPVLVGRESELNSLEDALLAANRGEGQIVLLAGDAGLGKTRLATELQRRAQQIGMTALWGGCSEAELALPYLPFLEALGNYLTTSDLDQVRQRLGPVRRELAHLFPQLEPESETRELGDPTQAKLRLFEAILALLRVPGDRNGLLVVLEDIHWSDASTRELLDYMTRRLRGLRIMILGTYRSDELHRKHPLAPMVQGWRRTKAAEIVQLEALPPEGIARMVGAIFDTDEVTPEFRDFLHRRSEGNPFVLEEFLKAALDRGDIYRTPTRWERKELSDLRLPQTVKDTILLRVERLSADQAEVLRTASVLGATFSYPTLVSVSGRDEDSVQAALQACVQQQLMEEESDGAERYRFRHALTREAIYEDLIAPKRRRLHARAAEVLRELPGTQPVDLAYHLLAAGRLDEAIPACIKAAEDAERRWGFREAADLYGRVLPHLGGNRLLTAQILCKIGRAYQQDGDVGKAPGYLAEGIPVLEDLGARQEAARYRLALGRCYWERSQPDAAKAEYERARATLEGEGPSEDLAIAYIRLAGLHAFELEAPEAVALAQKAVAIADAAGADAPRIWAYNFVGIGLARQGRVDEGLEFLDRSYREATDRDLSWIAANALGNATHTRLANFRVREALTRLESLGGFGGEWRPFEALIRSYCYTLLGEPANAEAAAEAGIALAEEAGASTMSHRLYRVLAAARAARGEFDQAYELLAKVPARLERQDAQLVSLTRCRAAFDRGDMQRAVKEAESGLEQRRWDRCLNSEERWVVDQAVEVLIAAGAIDRARATARLLQSTGADPADPYVKRMDGRLAAAGDDFATAAASLAAAAEFFHNAEYREEEWRTRRVLAQALAKLGNVAGAEAELRTVLRSAAERGHLFEAESARKQLADLGVEVPDEAAGPRGGARVGQPTELLVTVLFVDVRGYTGMSTKEAPERLADKVASLHRWARHEIERHHGLVDKFAGDAVMATFNVSGARLDHCLQALQAGIAIRDKAAAAGLPVGVGIAVGPAVVGQLTAGANISAVGEVTNLASRLQAQAAAGDVLLSEEAHRRTREWLDGQRLVISEAALELKGFGQPVTAFRVSAAAPAETR